MLPVVSSRFLRRQKDHSNELHDPGGELKRDTEKENPKLVQQSKIDDLTDNKSCAGNRETIKNVAKGPGAAELVRLESPQLATVENKERHLNKNGARAAPTPDPCRRRPNDQKDHGKEATDQRDRGIGQEEP